MELLIEKGIAIPTNVRGNGNSGDKRMVTLKPVFDALTEINTSILIPATNYAKAQEERKHIVYRANKYGKTIGKEFLVAAIDGQPAIAATEAMDAVMAEDGVTVVTPAIAAKAAIAAKPAGNRVYLTGLTVTDTPLVIVPLVTDAEKLIAADVAKQGA